MADERQLAQLRDASLCHGWAGLLQSTWRAAAAADGDGDGVLSARLPHLHARLDQHLRQHGTPPHDGLLDGTTGIHLAQHTTTTPSPPATRWDACLLLDG